MPITVNDLIALNPYKINDAAERYLYNFTDKGASVVTPSTLRASVVRFDAVKGVAAVRPFNPAFARIENDVFKRAVLHAVAAFTLSDINAARDALPADELIESADAVNNAYDVEHAKAMRDVLRRRYDAAAALIRDAFGTTPPAYNRTIDLCARMLYGNVAAPKKDANFDALIVALRKTRESVSDAADESAVNVHDLRALRKAYDAVNLALWVPSAAHGVGEYVAHVSSDMTVKLYRLYVRRVSVDKKDGVMSTLYADARKVYSDIIALLFDKVQAMHAAESAAAAAAAESAAAENENA